MTVLDLSVTIDDADYPRLITAAREVFSDPNLTEAQVTELMRQYAIQQMKQLVKNYEHRMAIAAAESDTYDFGAT